MSNSKKTEKIGRESVKTFNNKEDTQEEHCTDNASGPSSLAYSGDNEEEFLRATFARLGVGLDGFLSLEELTKVCHAIGMDKVAAEVIDQLFSRLDVDRDGRISFEEFVRMFQNGGPEASQSLQTDDSSSQDSSLLTNSSCLPSVSSNSGMFVSDISLFTTLDPDGSGYVAVSKLVDAWFSVGFSDGARLLSELGLPHRGSQRVRLRDLGAALEEELRPQQESTQLPRQAALLSLLHEVKGLRSSLECARGERDKYRWDLGEANHRLALLAQELDDHNATMESNAQKQLRDLERQYKEQIRDLQEALSRERDSGRESALSDSRELLSLNSHLQEEETRLRARVLTLERDLKKLEVENLEVGSKWAEAEKQLAVFDKQTQELHKFKSKVAELESLSPREDELRKVLTRVEDLLTENQRLRDTNDELIAQVDAFSARFSLAGRNEDYSLDGSCIGDYLENSSIEGNLGGVKRRGGSSPFRKSSPQEGISDEDEGSPRESKIRKRSRAQIGFQYIDVSSHDESFLDESLNQFLEKSFMRPMSNSTSSSVQSQPSSLPPYLHGSLPKGDHNSKEVKDLKSEIELLKTEKMLMADEMSRTQQLLQKSEENCPERMEPQATHFSSPPSITSSSTTSRPLQSVSKKCQQCLDLEGRLNVALEELEMSLKREQQSLVVKSEDNDVAMNRMQTMIQHCQELEGELTVVKTEAVQVIQQRNQLLKEKEGWTLNEASSNSLKLEELKKLVHTTCQDLCSKMKRKRLRSLIPTLTDVPSGPPSHCGRDTIPTILEEEEPEEDGEGGTDTRDGGLEAVLRRELERVEKEATTLEECCGRERDLLEKQKALAEDRLSKTEKELQALRSDYEKTEDYWSMKFQEEQDYYEEERRLYDEKFSALESKIKEYEEMALAPVNTPVEVPGPTGNGVVGEAFSDDSEDRLSTIDESAVWERQVTELEEEVKCLQKKLKYVTEEKENLDAAWREKFSAEQRHSSSEVNKLKSELEHTKASSLALETQLLKTKEELEHIKQNFGHESDIITILNQGLANVMAEDLVETQTASTMEGPSADILFSKGVSQEMCSGGGKVMLESLKNSLQKCQKRIKQLEHKVKIEQRCSSEIMSETSEQHKSEIQTLQSLMTSTQQMLNRNVAQYKEVLTKIARSDKLVQELYMENTHLMFALQLTEKRQKAAEEQLRNLEMASLAQME